MHISRWSIKHILFLIVGIIALPAICIIVNSGIEQRKNAVHNAKSETRKLAETIVNEQKNLIASTHQLFIALSQLPEVKNHKRSELQAILIDILSLSPQFSNLFIAEPSGEVWASAVPENENLSVADRRYFKNALASGKLSSGEYNVESNSNTPSLNFGYPLKDEEGRVTAVLCADLSLGYYRQMFDRYNLPKGASVALLDHNGIILGRAVEPEKYVGKQANLDILRYMLEGPEEETSIGTSSVIGDSRIQTYRKLILGGESEPYMYVRAGIPTRIVMSESNSALFKNLVIYSLALLVAFFLSWRIGKTFIIDRILLLQRSSQRLADGELNTRVAHEAGGGEIGELGQAFDDMAKKLASREEALRASERNYRDIFNTTHDALIVIDASGRISEVNKTSEDMFGFSREQLLQMSIEKLIAGHPPYSFTEALQLIEKSMKEGTQAFEWLCKRGNGEVFWTEIAITPTSEVKGGRVLAVIRDISDRKEIEKMREAMLSNISHEMRTPLTAMLGFLEFVIENPVGETELREYHTIMHREAERLNEMITNFLDMQRLKAKLSGNHFKPVDLRTLIEGVVALFAGPAALHSFVVGVPATLPPVLGDAELLHQAIVNLLSNAVKYSPQGSEITLDARLEGKRAILSVKDQGIGIPPESLEKVFDMFYRVQITSKHHVTGTGLGLALVKEIAETHKGQVWAESTLGHGSTFYLSLPVVRNDQQ